MILTLFSYGNDDYVKLLYNNQGIIKFGDMYKVSPTYINEIIIPTSETLLNRQNVISIYCDDINSLNREKIIFFVNSNKIYENSLNINISLFTH